MEPTRPIGEEEAQIEYDADAVRPFLGRLKQTEPKREFFHGEAAFPNTLTEEDRNYYYHATMLGNLPGILEQGLDPARGGEGGAGAVIAAPVNKKSGKYFAGRDRNSVYLADNAEIAARYAFEYDDKADGYIWEEQIEENKTKFVHTKVDANISKSPVILRIRKEKVDKKMLDKDSAEAKGAHRTTQKLIPRNLEILTEGGWTPLRDWEVRQKVYRNANETLGRMGPYNRLPEDENDIRARKAAAVAREAAAVVRAREAATVARERAGRVRIPLEDNEEGEVQRRPRQMRENSSVSPAKITEPSKDKGFGL